VNLNKPILTLKQHKSIERTMRSTVASSFSTKSSAKTLQHQHCEAKTTYL